MRLDKGNMKGIIILAFVYIALGTVITSVMINRYFKRPQKGWDDPSLDSAGSRSPYIDEIKKSQEWLSRQDCEQVRIKSFDGLTLAATLLTNPQQNKKETVILMHGYKSLASFDFAGIYEYFYGEGYNVLLCDQRTHGNSEGTYITLGIKERYDCLSWIDCVNTRFGTDDSVWLFGVSMGAATVLMAAGHELPPNVKGIIADCGFTSPGKILELGLKNQYHLPAALFMPFINLGIRIFCGYGPYSYSTLAALSPHEKKSQTPLVGGLNKNTGTNNVKILFVHGTKDNFVPLTMSEENFAAFTGHKVFLKTGAEHAASFLCDRELYVKALKDFMQ
ncbi:alpha/beta hydrolase [Treponema parvum]|uniref:alpha/beta hydrolase n=1 Tax=Treponema parvum TaxID=138851 RepID=UPI001AEC49A5|nr:alpha/beta hydrolase [Treponema parvum]QTQ15890.1 alpha/beta hydrolase [Treponema parvum]